MLKVVDAMEMAEKLRTASRNQRAAHAALWSLNMAYAQNRQWSFHQHRPGLGHHIYQLQEIIDPRRTDVRVSFDIIRPLIRRTVAEMKPQKLEAHVVPKPAMRQANVVKHVYDAFLADKLAAINGLKVWREIQWPRAVLGTMGIRRQIKMEGKPLNLPIESKKTPGRNLSLRNLNISWDAVFPWEFLRMPSTRDFDPNLNETIIGIEKPRTVQWIKRNFGITVETASTYGQMMGLHDQLIRTSGWGNRFIASASDDTTPAVQVYEFYFQDPDEDQPWPWLLMAYAQSGSGTEAAKLRLLSFGPSPFASLPFHFIYHDKPTQGPWADGIPQLLKSIQDITNLARSTWLRTTIDQGNPKWLAQTGTIDNPSTMLSNRSDVPIMWTRHSQNDAPPSRIAPGQVSPQTMEVMARAQEDAMFQANTAQIQFGQQVKRGQSAEAYREVGSQAAAVQNDRRVDDQLTLNELILATLVDQQKLWKSTPRIPLKRFGNTFPRPQIATAFGNNPLKFVSEARVVPDSLRPETPRQIKQNLTEAAREQLIDPATAVFEMQIRGGVTVDSIVKGAIERQQNEIELILAGQLDQVVVDMSEDHQTSINVLKKLTSSAAPLTYTDEQNQALQEHWQQHKQAQQELLLFDAQGVEPGQQPPGAATQPAETPQSQPGAVGPAINVA